MLDMTKLEVLSEYQKRLELLRSANALHKEIKTLEIQEVLYLKLLLHKTKRQESMQMTYDLINYICAEACVTAEEIYIHFGWSNKPVLARLKIFKEFGLVKRLRKKYYVATPRMLELKEKYLSRICEIQR